MFAGKVLEAPGAAEFPQRSPDQFHVNPPARLQGIPRGYRLPQPAHGQGQRRYQVVFTDAFDFSSAAPGQKSGIGLNIVYQRKHLIGRKWYDRCPVYLAHINPEFRRIPATGLKSLRPGR